MNSVKVACRYSLPPVPNMVHNVPEALPAFFFALASGREPVREWLRGLNPEDRKVIGEDIKDVEFAWPVGLPLCRSLAGGLWEVRSDLGQGRTARVLFCIDGGRMILLHAFIKKTQKTPAADLGLARKRMRELG
jgi:phage-related protein